jgi:1-deoxy-D-xylulose-5-phosphate reductoisomerase
VAKKRVAILGSTGSIGRQALDVIERYPDRFEVVGLAAGRSIELLAEQTRKFNPAIVSAGDAAGATDLAQRLATSPPARNRIASGTGGLLAVAVETKPDILLAATDGAVAFDAVFAAVDAGIDVAIANKELVVAAGELLFAHARASGARLLPVDSEHSAIFQCLKGEPVEHIASVILTASGGPFWNTPAAEMRDARVSDALKHPTWQMGVKNTIDSATLMNKGLEVIEASRFFALPAERIHVLVHRTSVAHGFAIFTDGNVVGQFAPPDMRLPIGYALAYPNRLDDHPETDPLVALGGALESAATVLGFERPDLERFPCLALAYRALREGGTAPAALSAANEVAVAAFVDGKIRFGDIPTCIEQAMSAVERRELTLDAVRAADSDARRAAATAIQAAGREVTRRA